VAAAVADFNGDSLPDLYKDQDQAKGLQFNNGNGFDAAVTNWFIPNGEYSTPFGRLVDVNRDSLADGILSEYHVYPRNTYLNKGTGDWAAAANWIVPEPFNTTAFGDTGSRLVDINSDGLTDIIQVRPIDWTVTTWLNTGNGWQQRNDWRPASGQGADWGLTPESKLIDINADGLVDIARGMESEPQGTYYFATGKPADLLEIVTYPTGGTTTATYKSSARYRSSLNELLNPNLPIVVQTVKQLSTVDPVTGISNTETYTYEGGRYYYANAFDRKFAGFAKISLVDGSGNKTVTFYHQGDASNTAQGEFEDHYVKIGKPYRIEIYDSNDNLFKLTINRWDRFDLGGAAGFVKLLQTVDFTYDGNGTHKDKAESYEYNNGTGNITQKISWGEVQGNGDGGFSDLGSDKYVTNILYATGSTLGVSGLPSQETTVDQSGNKIKENRYYYDNMAFGSVDKGNQTKFEQWKDGSNYIHSQKTYNDYGLVTVETDPRDYATTYAYDSLNLYPQTVTNALNQVTQYVYDYSAGKPKQITDPNSLVFQFVYDGLDRQISEKQPDPATPANLVTKTEYFYTDTIGNVNVRKVDWLDSSNEVETYTYLDGLGRILQERRETETFGQFAVKDYGYDNRGLLNKESLPYFNSGATRTSPTTANALYTTYSYDPLARVTSSSNAVGNTINSYNDWRTTVTDANGKTKDLYHDAYDRLIRVDEHNLGNTYTTNYEYNGQDKLTKVTDALGNVRNFSYDGLGRRLSAEDLHVPTDTTFGVWNYQYDNNGNLVLRTDPKTQQVEYGYDRLNRVISEDYLGDGKAGEEIGKDEFVTANVSYGYDTCLNGIGRSCSLSNEALSQTNQYDALGQVTQEAKVINGQTYTSDYSYDFQGNRTLIVNPDGSRFRYTYNSGGQVESIDRKETTDSNYVPVVTDFDYAETGQVSYQAFASGATTTNTYDPSELYRLKRKLTVRNVPTGSTQNVQDLNYTYDAVGNVLQLNDQSELNTRKIITYAYDDLYRLTSARTTHAVAGQNYLQTYQYDAIGNLTYKSDQGTYVYEGNQGNSYANPHAVTKITANGGTITNLTYDQIGNLTSTDSTLTYDWDYNNRLRAVNQNGLLTQTASYGYDPSGIRVKATDFSQTLTIYPSDYYNLQGTTVIKHIMAEQDNIATIHGRGEEAVALANHADHLGGATVMTTLPSSVTTADLAEIIDYYPYGEIRWDSNPGGYLEQRKFIGEIYDQDTGLNYLNARYYNSAIGRFISEDKVFWAVGDSQRIKELTSQELQTILSDPQNLNSYAYARNNPLQYSDPTGLYSWSKFKKDVKNALQSTAKNTKQAWNDYMDWRQKSYERQLSMLEKYPNETNALLFLVGGIRIGKFNKGILETEVGNLEVYRGGNSFKVRAHDIELDANGLIKPGSGVSVNTNPKSVKQFGGAYRVGNLPEGLAVVQQGSDSGHYQITPTKPMTVEQYNKLLGQVELIPISK
jgi:RHS repeat-associated protein